MPKVEQSIEANVPVSTAYNQWTQFEEFPMFMDGVDEVRQIDNTHLHWAVNVGGQREEWDAEITEQHPDQRITWRAIGGKKNSGVVMFEALSPQRTRIDVEFEWESEGMLEKLGGAIGQDDRQVKADLERFKELVESGGVESGAWRGEVEHGVQRR